MREKLKLTRREAQEAIYGVLPGFVLIEDGITDVRRWSINRRIVLKRESDGKFFADSYSKGSTESQEERPWEFEEPDFIEVFPEQITKIIYK